MSEETRNKTTLTVMAENTKESDAMPEPELADKEMDMKEHTKTNSSNASEYDSADTYSDRENGESASASESEGSVIFEREEGDGQESIPAKKVDDDEDKKNPQYIPKRGTFYEHDDRTADDIESAEATDKTDSKDGKKKVWQDKKEKWNHDRFNDNEQAPKSRAELIAIYGYDIRNEDGPPRARRRRRYGRGPNKYTRNWEDVDAYGKPTVIRKTPNKKRVPRSQTDDSETRPDSETKTQQEYDDGDKRETTEQDSLVETEKEQRIPANAEENKTNLPQTHHNRIHEQHQYHQQPQKQSYRDNNTPRQNISAHQHHGHPQHHQNDNRQPQSFSKSQPRAGTGRTSKPKSREVLDSDYKGFTKSRQFKSSPANRLHGIKNSYNSNHGNNRSSVQELERDMSKMSVQEGSGGGTFKTSNPRNNNQRQGSMPPRLQTEQKGSKRYSSIRQRSLPETANPPFLQHTNYYGNEFSQANQPTPQQPQAAIITNNTLLPSNAQQLPQIPAQSLPPIPPQSLPPIPPQSLPPIPAQVPVTTTPILQAPPQFAPPFTPAPPFLQPAVPPATFIPQQTAPILNYVQGQPQYPQPPYQGFQQPFNAVNQPTELFQPQGGITYYSTQEQQAAQRAAPPKRPKAAIPIVAPPEHRGRGRSSNQQSEPPAIIATEREADNNHPGEIVVESAVHFEDAVETAAVQ